MRITRIFNNSVVLAVDDQGNEKMVLGKGIGFNNKVNDPIEDHKIEKTFVLETSAKRQEFEQAMQITSAQNIELTKKVMECAEQDLQVTFDDTVFIGLLDHISYALQRVKQKDCLKNALLWEIKKFYHKEFIAAMHSLDLIEIEEGLRLGEDEAGFIAMHFVNGQQNSQNEATTFIDTQVIQDILNIIKFHFKMDLDETTVNFNRFIIHLRYLLQRIHTPHEDKNPMENELFEQVWRKYQDTYQCVKKICIYLESRLQVIINNQEVLYLMLHINRLTLREKDTN